MGTAVKKTISLPPDLARDAEALARAEGRTLSAVIQDACALWASNVVSRNCVTCKATGADRPARKASFPNRTWNVTFDNEGRRRIVDYYD